MVLPANIQLMTYLDYQQQRANEMQRNDKLSHSTVLTAVTKSEKGLENVLAKYSEQTNVKDGYISDMWQPMKRVTCC